MNAPTRGALAIGSLAALGLRGHTPEPDVRDDVLLAMAVELRLSDAEVARVRAILRRSPALGQGNPALTHHPMTREACHEARRLAEATSADDPRCGGPNMVPIYDPSAGEGPDSARVCIDQFEVPGLTCEYPFVHVTAREAVLLCEAIGKRICDAHEWEGACAGALRAPDVEYAWGRTHGEMRRLHNLGRERVWAYGPEKDHARCATGSDKTPGCKGGWARCGSNTYPSGAFPGCVSPFGVYDLHGNAAEHMNLPLRPADLASAGGHGWTEMKGSWFIFARYEAHEDDCRWRAPNWHGSTILDRASHSNYHLGFRCCGTALPADAPREEQP